MILSLGYLPIEGADLIISQLKKINVIQIPFIGNKKIAPSRGWCYFLARPEGFEPPTFTFVVCYSIQLSYGRIIYLFLENKVDYITFIASLSKEKFVSCGMIIVVLVPISLRLITSIVPLCLSMIHFIIARPRPEPPVFRARDSSER